MAYFKSKTKYINPPVPEEPGYIPPSPPTPGTPEQGSTPDIPRPYFYGQYTFNVYINNSDNDVYRKSLNQVATFNITLKESVDLVNPVILIESTTDLTDCNYCKLGEYYYYATVTLETGSIYRFTCHMDGLMSCDLSNCIASVVRSASNYNRYIRDNIPCASYEQVKTMQFSKGFNKNLNYLLVAIGGGSTENG